MREQSVVTQPRFVDEQEDSVKPLPIFVIKTNLRSVLQKSRTKTLLDLATRTAAPTPHKPDIYE